MYIYALSTDTFKSKRDYYDGSPDTEYFYVGRTENIKSRKSGHASNAKNGSTYPYHEKIRSLGENWDLVEIDDVPDEEVSDQEEFYIIKLTIEGHQLLNIKRGDKTKKTLTELFNDLKHHGVKSATDYAKLKIDNRQARIEKRELKQIESSLVHLGLDETGKQRHWRLGKEEFYADRYLRKKEIAQLKTPSSISAINEIMQKIELALNKT